MAEAAVTSSEKPYRERIEQLSQQLRQLESRSQWLSRWRGLTCLPALAIAVYNRLSPPSDPRLYLLAGGLFVSFLVLVAMHEQLLSAIQTVTVRRQINEDQLARVSRNWDALPAIPLEIPGEYVALARDLDVVGRGSVYQWLCTAETPLGRDLLRDWLLHPAAPEEVRNRQAAVRHLGPRRDFCEELQLRGRLWTSASQGPTAFLEWAEGVPWLGGRPRIGAFVRLLTLAFGATPFTVLLGVPPAACLALLAALLAINIVVNIAWGPAVHRVFNIVASRQRDVEQYASLLTLFHQLPAEGTKFNELRGLLGRDIDEPLRHLRQLSRRVAWATARHSPLWGIPYLLCQGTLLCDFHLLSWIEAWQRQHGRETRRWLLALAELEALAALATIAHDQPTWTFPRVEAAHLEFQATALGHPLLRNASRVTNDVRIGPRGTFLLVSGSNMSGKSTLLRSVGVNVLLAQAGGPVCATDCSLPSLEIATSMRIGDSLTEGVSFYMAELKRLKEIVDHARRVSGGSAPRLLFLLDEILLGTNSSERHLAVIRVVSFLLSAGAIGAISTHDLELAASPELASGCQPVHFREFFTQSHGKSEMHFDYRMRPGIATTTNALKLLELVGLDRTP